MEYRQDCRILRTFALIVYAHPYCACNSCRNVMPRHNYIECARCESFLSTYSKGSRSAHFPWILLSWMVGYPYFFLNGLLLLINIYVLREKEKNLSSGSLFLLSDWCLNYAFWAFRFAVQQFLSPFFRVKSYKKDINTRNYSRNRRPPKNFTKIVCLRSLIFDIINYKPCKHCWITLTNFLKSG